MDMDKRPVPLFFSVLVVQDSNMVLPPQQLSVKPFALKTTCSASVKFEHEDTSAHRLLSAPRPNLLNFFDAMI